MEPPSNSPRRGEENEEGDRLQDGEPEEVGPHGGMQCGHGAVGQGEEEAQQEGGRGGGPAQAQVAQGHALRPQEPRQEVEGGELAADGTDQEGPHAPLRRGEEAKQGGDREGGVGQGADHSQQDQQAADQEPPRSFGRMDGFAGRHGFSAVTWDG